MPAPSTVAENIELWLATPEAANHFQATALSPDDARRWESMRDPLPRSARGNARRTEWLASRALFRRVAPPSSLVTSLSHSHGHAALACAPLGMAIGIDIEALQPRAVDRLADFAFSEREAVLLRAAPVAVRSEWFYRLWTLKEAAAKALGLDLFTALRECLFYRDGDGWRGELPTARPWSAWSFAPRADLLLSAVAIGSLRGAAITGTPLLHEWPASGDAVWQPLLQIVSRGA